MRNWNWTPRAYRLRDYLIAGACLLGWVGVVVLFLIKASN
jgi:hypothetical protein